MPTRATAVVRMRQIRGRPDLLGGGRWRIKRRRFGKAGQLGLALRRGYEPGGRTFRPRRVHLRETFAGRAYFVCCDARTGSNLLAATLRTTGGAGKPFEYFSRAEIDKPWLRAELRVPDDVPFASFPDWRDYILRAGSEAGGVFAASVHYWQLGHCVETFRAAGGDSATPALDVLRGFFPNLRLVWLRRKNVVAQAISHHVAISTDIWDSRLSGAARPGESDRGAAYDFDKIDHQVASALAATQGWRETLRGADAITLPLAYEDLAANLAGAVRRIFAHVGIDPGDAPIQLPGLEKQAGSWSLEMERRYREERRARGLGAVGDEAGAGLSSINPRGDL
jgi:LPS sulfotransferase NodH